MGKRLRGRYSGGFGDGQTQVQEPEHINHPQSVASLLQRQQLDHDDLRLPPMPRGSIRGAHGGTGGAGDDWPTLDAPTESLRNHRGHMYSKAHRYAEKSTDPWELSALALLGTVVILSALFLHMLSDTAEKVGQQQEQQIPKRSNRPRKRAGSKMRKKTDEWMDDEDDILLDESFRSETPDVDDLQSPYYLGYPSNGVRDVRKRANVPHDNTSWFRGYYLDQSGRAIVNSGPYMNSPGATPRVTVPLLREWDYRRQVPLIYKPPCIRVGSRLDADTSPAAKQPQHEPTRGPPVQTMSTISSFESLADMATVEDQQDQEAGQLHPATIRANAIREKAGLPQASEHSTSVPHGTDSDPPSGSLSYNRSDTITKTPRAENRKNAHRNFHRASTFNSSNTSGVENSPGGGSSDGSFQLPFVPDLQSSSPPPKSMDLDDLKGHVKPTPPSDLSDDKVDVYKLMESGSISMWQEQVAAESLILERAAFNTSGHDKAHSRGNSAPPSEYAKDCPRQHMDHKRSDLTVASNAAASLQVDIAFSELGLVEVIGGGGFGQVWKAMWRGTPVAVKVLTGSAQSKNVPRAVLQEFAAEINLLRGMRHPNICLYMGACLDPPNRAIITELAANGSLWDALRLPLAAPYVACDGNTRTAWPLAVYQPDPQFGAPPTGARKAAPSIPPRGTWPWILSKKVACGAARGMAYLHSGKPPVLHRDLKSANILLDESYTPKVCDFGLSRLKEQEKSMTGNCGTVQWMAPEVLANMSYNEKADVYSYGIIVWELLTAQCPFEGMSAIQCAMAVLNKGQRPEIPKWCPPALNALLRACMKKNPDERPTFAEILVALDAMP